MNTPLALHAFHTYTVLYLRYRPDPLIVIKKNVENKLSHFISLPFVINMSFMSSTYCAALDNYKREEITEKRAA